jgi:Arc/MetJ-type ribon-helix-helix transcriptional regulator
MKLTIPAPIGRQIERRVRSGKYRSARDVLIAAMLRLDEHERLAGAAAADLSAMFPRLKEKIARGVREAGEGRVSDGEAFFAQARRAARRGTGTG